LALSCVFAEDISPWEHASSQAKALA